MLDLSIHVATVSHFHHNYNKFSIMYLINDSIVALPDAVPFLRGEFLTTRRPRIFCQRVDSSKNLFHIRRGMRRKSFAMDRLNSRL
jgi:hypothetical protein